MLIAIPIIVLAGTAFLAAGLIPGVAPAAAAALLAAALVRPFPGSPWSRLLFWLSLVLLAWVLITALPVPFPDKPGSLRTTQWTRIDDWLGKHGNLPEGPGISSATPRLSQHAGGTMRWLFLALGAWAIYWFCASLDLRRRLYVLKALVLLATAVGIGGVITRYVVPSGGHIWWWYPVEEIGGGLPFSPFVNRNHFAAFCAAFAPLAMTLTVVPARQCLLLIRGRKGHLEALCLTEHPAERCLYGACLLCLMAATLLSRSRGGTGALLLGLIVTALLWLRSGRLAGALAMIAGICALLLVVFWPDADFQTRLRGFHDPGTALGARLFVWIDALHLWRRMPVTGCGINAFRMIFPQITSWATTQEATHAESDVLQMLAETGLVGMLLFAATFIAACLQARHTRFRGSHRFGGDDPPDGKRHDHPEEALDEPASDRRAVPHAFAVAAVGSLAAMTLESLVDVPLRIPLAAWSLAAVLALAAPLPFLSRSGRHTPGRWMWPERCLLGGALIGLVFCLRYNPGWQWYYRDRPAWRAAATPADIASFLTTAPGSWHAWFDLGDHLLAANARRPPDDRARMAGWDALEKAVECAPRNPSLRKYVAWRYWKNGRWADARRHRQASLSLASTDHGELRRWVDAEWQAGFMEEARRLVEEETRNRLHGKQAAKLLAWMARREMKQGSVMQARKWLASAMRDAPDNPTYLRLAVECERRLGYKDREYHLLVRLLALDEANADAWCRLAELEREKGNRKRLEHALGMAVKYNWRKKRFADDLWKRFMRESEARSQKQPPTPTP